MQKPVGNEAHEKTLLIGSAIAGFLLSFLTGVLSGIGFGTVLLKALFFALLFTGIMYGILYLLSRLLSNVSEESEQYQESTGETVNIVLPEEQIIPEQNVQTNEYEESSDDLEKEIELVKNEQLVQKDEAIDQIKYGPIAKPLVTQDDLDVLPDIDSMSDVFAEISGTDTEQQDSTPLINYSGTATTTPGYDKESPEIIARAVQTLLRQDGKGHS